MLFMFISRSSTAHRSVVSRLLVGGDYLPMDTLIRINTAKLTITRELFLRSNGACQSSI